MYCPYCGAVNGENAFICSKCSANLSSISLQENEHSTYPYFGKRFNAWAIDFTILFALFLIFILIIIAIAPELSFIYIILGSIVIEMIYYSCFESSKKQATPGKQITGIKVTDLEGNKISFGKALFRCMVKMITGDAFLIGYLAIIFSRKKQGLHDMAAGTVVVYK